MIQNAGFESHGADVYSINSWNTVEDGILGSVLVESGTQINASGLDYNTGGSFDSNQHVRVDLLSAGANVFSSNSADTYAMLLSGLGLMGFVARRRTKV